MQFTDGKTNETRKTEISKSVACFFDENGVLCADLFDPVIQKMKESLSSEKKSN
jgi:signal peptidase complex subunit 2